MVDLKASIVLYKNEAEQVIKAMSGLLASGLDFKLVLSDNSPTDELRFLSETDSRVEYIFNSDNIGFGSAHNNVLRNSLEDGTKYHLVLNPDVYFDADVLPAIFLYMEENRDVGNLMPNVLFPDGSTQYLCKLLPSPANLIYRFAIPRYFHRNTKLNELFELRFWDHDHIENIPSLSGCFMFLNVAALEEVGIFDENIFMYIEDLDLNRRIHAKYRTVFFPDKTIYHEHNRESFRNKKLLSIHMQSAFYYFNKWGWLFDKARKKTNQATLDAIAKHKKHSTQCDR